jgi:predicted nucleic acid-binding protein
VIILDTNVISEPLSKAPSVRVLDWMRGVKGDEVYVTAISQAEMRFGVERLPSGRKRDLLEHQVNVIFARNFEGRVLSFDAASADAFARLVARTGLSLKDIDVLDAQVASIAAVHGAAVATRNTRHFQDFGVDLIDPWAA